jgi:serine/threonine-protein kinase ATR
VFQGLPRLLTLWFDLNSIQSDDVIGLNQDKANEMMVTFMKKIPPVSYYSVLSQLVSRIGHKDDDVVNILCAILKRILIKFPAQAMWQLGWLRHSIHSDRKKKGEDIFRGAQKGLQKIEEMRMHDLLEGSKDLFEFLINLAKYKPKRQDQKSLQIMSWKGKVELKEFLPPVQAALALSRITMGSSNSRDVFPRNVPRIRAFSSNVPMMSSKAKPKKLIAFAIPEASPKKFEQSSRYTTAAQPGDIGEMHFLVKQEAKGDLRKDARVQDLNNVINRLFAQSASSNKSNKWNHRRLKLRTFAVTCLSEDCGILEW